MLIITRRISERIIIGDAEVVFTILRVKGNQVRIGIDAPKDVSIHREEIYLKIKEQNDEAISEIKD